MENTTQTGTMTAKQADKGIKDFEAKEDVKLTDEQKVIVKEILTSTNHISIQKIAGMGQNKILKFIHIASKIANNAKLNLKILAPSTKKVSGIEESTVAKKWIIHDIAGDFLFEDEN